MLQTIRDKTHGWLISVVIGIVIILFTLWGLHGYLDLQNKNSDKIIAKVAGQTLSQHDFDIAYQRLYKQVSLQLKKQTLNKGLSEQLKTQTLQQWILTQTLAQAAYHDHYRISQSVVDAVLLHTPLFQSAGRFSSTRFYSVLNALDYTKLDFLSDLKKTLLISQVQTGLTETEFALPSEVNQAIKMINQVRDFAYIVIPVSYFSAKQIPISDADALAYYEKNKNHFIRPEQVSFNYIKLSLAALKDDKKFVEKRDSLTNLTYTHPSSLQPAAEALGLAIQSTPLFEQTGGTDALTKNPKIIAAAFSQDSLQGNNSPIIDLDDDTAIVLHVKQHTVSAVQAFAEVKAQIIETLKKQKAIEKNYAFGQQLLSELKEKGSFSNAEKSNPILRWQPLHHVARNADKPSPEIIKAAFNLPATKTGTVPSFTGFVKSKGNYVLIKLLTVYEGGDSKKVTSTQKKTYASALTKGFGQLDYEVYVAGEQKAFPVKR